MKIKDLIKELEELDWDIVVLAPWYEWWYREIELSDVWDFAKNINTQWWYWPHEDWCDCDDYKWKEKFKWIVL